jgi:hypothetical protein
MPDRPVGANADADGTSVALNQFHMLVSRVIGYLFDDRFILGKYNCFQEPCHHSAKTNMLSSQFG